MEISAARTGALGRTTEAHARTRASRTAALAVAIRTLATRFMALESHAYEAWRRSRLEAISWIQLKDRIETR